MNCIIFTGGNYPEKSKVIHFIEHLISDSIIIAADSGLNAAKDYGIKPDFFLGDMDSVSAEASAWFQGLKKKASPQNTETFPTDKDFSDTELALNKAKTSGADFIILIGGSGGRLDHLIGILELFKGENRPDLWLTEENLVCLIDSKKRRNVRISNLPENSPLSVFPIFNTYRAEKYKCKSKGLVWPLDNLDWEKGAVSLSNRQSSDSQNEAVLLYAEKGTFIVVTQVYASVTFDE